MENKDKNYSDQKKWYTFPPMRNVLLAGVIAGVASLSTLAKLIPKEVEIGFFIIAIVVGGYYWVSEGIKELLEDKKIGIDILMIAATAGSIILGMWEEAAFLVFLYGAAEGLEEFTYDKTRRSIRKLLDLSPKEARLINDGREEFILAEKLKVGDVFRVLPGESIPTDGLIIKGKSSINEAPITGESIPVDKKEGMMVFSGTFNQEGVLDIRTTVCFKDNTLSKMIHLVEKAQEQKGKVQTFIERFGNKYTPIVLFTSIALILVPLFVGIPASKWAIRAVVLLVAAAPCALIMSTPVAIAASIGKAGRMGVLIKGGIHLENLGKIRTVAFDKTGTLTKGKPVLTDIVSLNGNETEILKLAYSIEKYSEHPLAMAITQRAEKENIQSTEPSNFESIAGYGAKGTFEGTTIYVGKQELFTSFEDNSKFKRQIDKFRQTGKTVILVGRKDKVMGIFAIRDEIRPEAKDVINKLKLSGIHIAMLTGDNSTTAKAFAKELNINDVRADLRPEDKIKEIEQLEQTTGSVAMVGDGINDAPALAVATVGIAMGVAGSDAAVEAADAALMADDLRKVLFAIDLGKKAKKIIKQNIIFSIFVLAALIPTSIVGAITVAIAVFAHEASELLAVANGLRMSK